MKTKNLTLKKISTLIILMFTLHLLSACTSISTLQTAKTLKPGKSRHLIAIGVMGAKMNDDGSNKFSGVSIDSGEKTELLAPEYNYRRGVSENIDFGLKVTGLSSYGGDLKYQFLKSEKFNMATGLGLHATSKSFPGPSANINTEVSHILDYSLPLYISYDYSPNFTIYGAPKFIYRTIDGPVLGRQSLNTFGGSLGFMWGKTKGVIAEVSAVSFDGDLITQTALGFYF